VSEQILNGTSAQLG